MELIHDRMYIVGDIEGFSPQIGKLLSMMNYARYTTQRAVDGLTVDQLDYLAEDGGNSIGALLLHMAAVEYAYQLETFEKRELNEAEAAEWGAALDLGDRGRAEIRGNELSYYLDKLNAVRERTYELFRGVDDAWLDVEEPDFWYHKPANHYFMWFHVFEDEINHRGQIRLIRKKALNG